MSALGHVSAILAPVLQALSTYNELLRLGSDFAFTEYARVERALVLYQLGRVSDALLQVRACVPATSWGVWKVERAL